MGRAILNRVEDDQIAPLVEDLINSVPADTDSASEGVRTHTKLRLVTSDVTDKTTDEAQQPEAAPERQRFHIVGIDRLPMPDGLWTVVRGEVDGQAKALVFDAEHPPEFMLPSEPANEADSSLSRFRNSFLGRALFVLGGAIAAAACSPQNLTGSSQGDGEISKGEYGTHHAALTAADADHLGPPTLIPGSTWGDQYPNIAEIGGQKVLMFSRADGNMWYVDCAAFADCLAAGVGAPDLISGLPAVPGGSVRRGAIYQDAGGDKIAYGFAGTVGYRAIAYGAGGTLEAPVFGGALAPAMSTVYLGHMKIGGESHITWNSGDAVGDRNMITGVDTATGMTGADFCGVPHRDGAGVAIGSDYIDLGGGAYRCHLIQAPTLADLAVSVNYLNSQNVLPGPIIVNRLVNPRVFENYLVYTRYDENPPGSGIFEPRLYYAVVMEYCDNGVCAGGETPGSCPVDCPAPPDGGGDGAPDGGGDGAADGGGDGAPDGGGDGAADGGGDGATDGGGDGATDGGGDGATDGGGDGATDGGGDGATDGGDGATDGGDGATDGGGDVDTCDFAEAKVTITKGECNLDKCEDPFVDVVGACTFEVDLGNENPVAIEIDGRYGLDFLNDAGELLAGSYKVVDRGNDMDTVTGNLVTGVEGTTYGGELNPEANTYHVYCEDGRITISYNGDVIATLEAGQEQTFDLDDPTGDDDIPDGGDDDTPDAGPGVEPPPDNGGGCSCSIKGGSESNAAAAGMLLLLAVALMRRRKEKKA